ncbi:hypothetical protein FSP39_021380 [Pinctada imbricata]|uniref:AT-rich interactive domain-containing protein 2 n=1 Tax=Pinctada imbricata TaxID=66713 RepID=A0AA88YKG4_PINIB|nr:hypothetical protein FSP39_021380 [Pinctada imbricata]
MAVILNKDPFTYQQEHDEFLRSLRQFHSSRGTPFDGSPKIDGREVDLYLLYRRVISFGGWRKIVDESIWEQIIRDFKVSKGCSNGTQALKFIYVRYLDVYEKVHFHGMDPKLPDDDEENEGPLRKKICLPQFGIPHSYNYEWHRIHASARAQLGMSTDLIKYNDHEKLEQSLLSGLPNEVDFVINVCTLLSNESRHTISLEKSPNLLRLLMAHVGVFENDKRSLEAVYQEGWVALKGENYFRFWLETVQEKSVRHFITNNSNCSMHNEGESYLHLGREQGLCDTEGQRVMQLAVIMRNLSFEEENMKFMTESDLVFRFVMLCIHSSYGCLRQLALDTLANISEKFDLCPDDNTQMLLQLLKTLTGSDDKYDVVRGLEMVSKLSLVDYNDTVLGENLEEKIIEDIIRLMNVFDIQIIVSSLEALYQLSELGERTTTKIAAVRCAVDLLVTLLSTEAQSYGPDSLVGIKVVEYCPPPHLVVGTDQSNSQHVDATPVTQALPSSQKTPQQHSQGTPSCDVEATTCSWLQSTYEAQDGTSVTQVHMYADYISFAKKFALPQILPSQAFFNCVKVVFPDLHQYNMEKADGLTEGIYKGLSKRLVPLPVTVSSTVGMNRHPASSVVCTVPNVMSAPNQPPLSTVDLTQTPTLRQRLMEPPKLSALQASPSLLPIGGAQVSKQQDAIYTSSKPVTQTQTSASSMVQVSQADQQIPKRQIQRDGYGKFSSVSAKSLHHHILKKQNTMKKDLYEEKILQVCPDASKKKGTPVQTQHTAPIDLLESPGSSDTKNVKNLLAKKILTQTPVPIAPKVPLVAPPQPSSSVDIGGNPMHLLTFTTQQSNVIQGTLQQNLSPQTFVANIPQHVTDDVRQPYNSQNCLNSKQQVRSTSQTFMPSAQVHAIAEQIKPSAHTQAQIHGIQSVVDGVQQYIISQSDDSVFSGSCVNSSQSSHGSQSPKIDKNVKLSNSPNRIGSRSSRSSSPKGSSPKRQSSSSSQSNSSRSTSPKSYELEVCGEVERAKDVVKVGLEARIERVENLCLNQIKKVIPLPSKTIPISSTNDILSVTNGSSNTGQTGSFTSSNSCLAASYSSNMKIFNNQTMIFHQPSPHSVSHITPLPSTAQTSFERAQSFNDEIVSSMSSGIHSQSSESIISSEGGFRRQVKQDSFNLVQGGKSLLVDSEAPVENPSSPPKLKAKYVCSQDETEAAVSSLLINNVEESQESVLSGSDDVGLPSAVVNAPDETEAAISAIAGFLENDLVSDIDEPREEVMMNGDFIIHQAEDQAREEANLESNAESVSLDGSIGENPAGQVSTESVKEIVIGYHRDSSCQAASDLHTKQSKIILNGDLHSPDSDIIPSPISDNDCPLNGVEKEDVLLQRDAMGALNKLSSKKTSKMNGISLNMGNHDFDSINLRSKPQKLENGIKEDNKENSSDLNSEKNVVRPRFSIRVNGCYDVEMHLEETEKHNGNIDSVSEFAARNDDEEQNFQGPCYELASEAEAEDSGEILIENEMCLQPIRKAVLEPETVLNKQNSSESPREVAAISSHKAEKNEYKMEKFGPEEVIVDDVEKKEGASDKKTDMLPDTSTGCVDILKAAIESEKIDELDLNGDSNDSLPVVTEGIYSTGLQMTVQNGHIPMGNDVTTAVGANSINLIPNVFSTVQAGLVVGTIVSINNNMLTTSNVPLPYIETHNPQAKVNVDIGIYPHNRPFPKQGISPDVEICCDSIVSPLTDSSDRHSIFIDQKPIISVQNVPNIHASAFLSVQTTQAKQIISTTTIPTVSTQTSPSSTRSSERKPRKRNRSQSGSTDSRSSSLQPIFQPASQPTLPELMCEWIGCRKCFGNTKSVFNHVYQSHIKPNNDGICRWEGCEKLQRKKWSLVTHIQDHHCSDAALRVAAIRRIQSQECGVASTPTTVPALVYPPDAAWQAIRRFEPKPPYSELKEQREGPVTKHIRLTAALVLRNLARYSSHGRSLIKKHERQINFMAMSALESSNALANCLWEVLHDH